MNCSANGFEAITIFGSGFAACGAGGLGVLIFRGLHMMDNGLLLAGTLPVALLAVAADNLLEWGELRVQRAMGVFSVTTEEER